MINVAPVFDRAMEIETSMDVLDLMGKGKIKRFFRATRKLNTPNLVFHITQRAAGREPLFVEESDYLIMLAFTKDVANDCGLAIYAFCLMPNHIHFLLSPSQANLYDAMRDLFSRYALRFNRKYERKGHLFGGPYRQAVCLEDSYLLAASLYIHLNPVRAGLISDPRLYRWSSCRLYCNDRAPRSFVKPEFVLNLLKEGDNQKESYREILRQSLQLEMGEILEREDAIDDFRSRLAAALPQFFKKLARINQVAEHSGIKFSSYEEIEELMEKVRNSGFKNKAESREGRRYLIEQLIARGYKRDEICNRLGMSRKTIYNILHPG